MALSDAKVRNAKPKEKAYKLSDVDSLYLLVVPAGGKYWRFDYRYNGKRKTLESTLLQIPLPIQHTSKIYISDINLNFYQSEKSI